MTDTMSWSIVTKWKKQATNDHLRNKDNIKRSMKENVHKCGHCGGQMNTEGAVTDWLTMAEMSFDDHDNADEYCIVLAETKQPGNMEYIPIVKLTMKSGFGPCDKSWPNLPMVMSPTSSRLGHSSKMCFTSRTASSGAQPFFSVKWREKLNFKM